MIAFILNILLVVAADAYQKTVTSSHPSGLIFDGKNVQINEAPYYVTMTVGDGKPSCGGVILSASYILTAAHCFSYYFNSNVRAGSNLRNVGGSIHGIAKPYRFNYALDVQGSYLDWDTSRYTILANDLVILQLLEPIKFDKTRQPISLFNESEDVGVGVDAIVYGWNNVNGSEHLTSRIVPTLDLHLCNEAYKDVGSIPAGQICAAYPGASGKSGCVGDSGGPLVVNGRLAGILSWGNGCVKPHYPGLYTEIAYYRSWIDRIIQGASS